MRQMEFMLKESKSKIKNNDLHDCISLLEANHGLLNNDRKKLIRRNIKTLIDKLLPDFVKYLFVISDESNDEKSDDLTKANWKNFDY